MTTTLRRPLLPFVALVLSACGPAAPSEKTVDEIAAAANANCEPATAALRSRDEKMLPGRACGNCHRVGGQAAGFVWTVAGTVFGSRSASCNGGGLAGVKVEIFEGTATTAKLTLTTNSVGNFFSKDPVTFPIRAKVSKDGRTQEMFSPMSTGVCASCHQNPGLQNAPGRIHLE